MQSLKHATDAAQSDADPPSETNVLVAGSILIGAVALDALTALPVNDESHVPTSLRTCGMTLVAIAGANPIMRSFTIEQRGLTALLLVAVAFTGSHSSSTYIRTADAAFVLVTGSTGLAFFARGGIDRADSDVPCYRRAAVVMYVAALLCYVGARLFRFGVTLAGDVQAFRVMSDDFDTRGYAYGSSVIAACSGFVGAVSLSTGILMFLSSERVVAEGCEAIAHATAFVAAMLFVVALIGTLEQFATTETLPAIYGSSACTGKREACDASYRARRFNAASLASCEYWSVAAALTVFSFPKGVRFSSRHEALGYENDQNWVVVSALTAAAALVAVWAYTTLETVHWWSIASLTLSIAAVFVAGCWSSVVGGVMQTLAMVFSITHTVDRVGVNAYVTFVSNVAFIATTALIGAFTAVAAVGHGLWSTGRQDTPILDVAVGVLIVSAMSVQFGLLLSTAGLMACYDGTLVVDDLPVGAQAQEWTLRHFTPFFFLAAVFSARAEPFRLSNATFRFAWIVPMVIVGLVWLLSLLATQTSSPYTELARWEALAIGIAAGLVPWVLVAVLVQNAG